MAITTTIEDHFRAIAQQVIDARPPVYLLPLEDFCKQKKISRITVWRAEKRGQIKLTRIGKRIFVDLSQFAAPTIIHTRS